jgi:CHASE2 domain-containing sensor protein
MTKDKLVTLSLGNGDLYRGFETVAVRLWQPNGSQPMLLMGALPAQPELSELYRQWKVLYSALLQRLNRSTRLEVASEGTTNVSESEFEEICTKLSLAINHWLNSDSFRSITNNLYPELNRTDEIRFLIETNDNLLQKLPWHLWKFFEAYPRAEVGISAPAYQNSAVLSRSAPAKVRILVILGNSDGININKDWEALTNLSRQGKAKIKTLYQPKAEQLNEQLWRTGWDILFFAGHSFSEKKGILRINQKDSISLDRLKNALGKAIGNGLKLAIFNSCDGTGLARAIFDLHIPQVIVMREEIPDAVAHRFLSNFLIAFFAGKSLFTAVREARERLEGIQQIYPCASWLPIIYQNPSAEPLVLSTASTKIPFWIVALAIVMVSFVCIGARQIGLFESVDLWAFDQLMQLRPAEGPDDRLLLIEITAEDLQYQQQKKMQGQGSLSDQALKQLMDKLEPLHPLAIGIDIFRDSKVDPKYPQLAKQFQKNDHIFSVCSLTNTNTNNPMNLFNPNDRGIGPPPEAPPEQIGFANIVLGNDGILRSHLLYLEPKNKSLCKATQALSLQLALKYLDSKNIEADPSSTDYLKLGETAFIPLSDSMKGGYRNLDARGYQILLNYRKPIEEISYMLTLTQALEKPLQESWVKDKIILIGVTASSEQDNFLTTLSTDRKAPGLMIQAQMVSQIISAVLDNRPLLWVWPDWGENLWIFAWTALGGIFAWQLQSRLRLVLGCVAMLATLSVLCWILLRYGGWVPLVPCIVVLIVTPMSVKVINKLIGII